MEEIHVLLIEDSGIVHRKVRQYLADTTDSSTAFPLSYSETLAGGIEILEKETIDVVVLDLGLPDSQGLDGLKRIKSIVSDMPVVILTANNDTELGKAAIEHGAQDFIAKEYLTQGIILRRSIRFAIERQAMRDQLQRQNVILEERNRDLDAFSHSVAHDLRSPITVIKGLTKLIPLQLAKARPEEDIRQSWEDMSSSIERMEAIISSLLQFATSDHDEIFRTSIDLSVLANEIAREQQLASGGNSVCFVCADKAEVEADLNLMRIVMANLLSNAWKYSRKKECPEVEFGVVESSGKCTFFVSDNGAGFDMNKSANLFEPFRRLHSQSEFKGIGIGLATVRKIIERHGGKIWAESEPNVKTTFYFTLGS